jgi:chain length determinant protein tyrosine kinase EpsG
MTLQQFLGILRARRRLVGLLFILPAGAALGVSLWLPPRYTAAAQVLVDTKSPDPVSGVLLPGRQSSGYMATQVDILTSQRVALDVVDSLGLVENPRAVAQWHEATGGDGSIRHYFSDLLLEDLDVRPSRESSVLTVAYSGTDPAFVASVANAFATAYVDLSLELKGEPARQSRGHLDAQAQALRERLESARSRLAARQRATGSLSADDRFDVENTRLAELSSQLVTLQTSAGDAEPALSRAKAELDRQRARVLEMRQLRDEVAGLQRDVDRARGALDAVSQRQGQGTLERQGSRSDVVVLTSATQPREPRPRLVMNTALGALFGVLLGVGGALGAEMRNRRVRGPHDLRLASGMQPIGTLRDAFEAKHRTVGRPLAAGLLSWLSPARADHAAAVPGAGAAAADSQVFSPTMFGALPSEPEARPSTAADAEAAPARMPIGRILVQAGLIHPPEVERILAWARAEGVRFGEAAVARKLVTSEQVERALAYQFDYAVLERGKSAVSEEVVAAYDGRNPLVADLRRLRAKIRSAQIAAAPASPLKSLAVISSGSGDGKSFLAANLAVTFSQMGQRTLLIDADLRRGRLHRMFGLGNATGLSSMLNRSFRKGALQRVPGLPSLTVLTRGPDAPNPSELLSRDAFEQLLEAFTKSFDIVILDTPGAAEEPDATLVAQHAGAALLMARQDVSAVDAVIELVQGGGTQRVAVLGSVLNQA